MQQAEAKMTYSLNRRHLIYKLEAIWEICVTNYEGENWKKLRHQYDLFFCSYSKVGGTNTRDRRRTFLRIFCVVTISVTSYILHGSLETAKNLTCVLRKKMVWFLSKK